MDWDNEYWIRAYVKDSPSFARCHWDTKGLFFLIARKVNAAGIIRLVKGDPVESCRYLSVLLEAPWNEIRPKVQQLLETETIHIPVDWSVLAIPNFYAAQHAKWSDKFRKKAERQRKKDTAEMPDVVPAAPGALIVPPADPVVPTAVLPGGDIRPIRPSGYPSALDETIEPLHLGSSVGASGSAGAVRSDVVPKRTTVTPCDIDSDGDGNNGNMDMVNVTPCDVLSTTNKQTDRSEERETSSLLASDAGSESEEGDGSPEPDADLEAEPGDTDTSVSQLALLPEVTPTEAEKRSAQVRRVWEHYMGHWEKRKPKGARPQLTSNRRAQILRRIKEFGIENVLLGIDRLWASEWRVRQGYSQIDYVIRSTEQLEKILAQEEPASFAAPRRNGRNGKVLQAAADPTYVGTGTHIIANGDGTFRDQRGDAIELDTDLESAEWG